MVELSQGMRVCTLCNKRVLSGLLYVERGFLGAFLCKACGDGAALSSMKGLTQLHIKKIKDRNIANRT